MAQSDDQGPDWFFRWVGYHDANMGWLGSGAVVAFIIVFGTLVWSIWPI